MVVPAARALARATRFHSRGNDVPRVPPRGLRTQAEAEDEEPLHIAAVHIPQHVRTALHECWAATANTLYSTGEEFGAFMLFLLCSM